MLKQKVTVAMQWSLRFICGRVLGLLVMGIVAPTPGATQGLLQAKTQPDPRAPKLVKFFKDASPAEPSRKDVVFTAGRLELTGGVNDHDEFSGAATAHSPTYVVGRSGLDRIRHYIGFSFDDPVGGNKAQFLQLTNLTVGRNYRLDVYVSGNYGDGNCYYATSISGGTVVSGGCKGWTTIGQFDSMADVWQIVVNAQSPTMTLRLGNFWDASNSRGVSRFIYLDAIGLQSALPRISTTTVDANAAACGATSGSHNQKVVANAHGIFMTHLHEISHCQPRPDKQATWRLSRSVDGGETFATIYEASHQTAPPVLETDSQGNIYLAHPDYRANKAYVYRFLASDNFQKGIVLARIEGASRNKFAMEIDEARGQLYYFNKEEDIVCGKIPNISICPDFFRIRLSDGKIFSYRLTINTPKVQMEYPHLYLDENGHLYAAWTTNDTGTFNYRSIHFIRSLDGGVTWQHPNGRTLPTPIVADETGPSVRITLDDEFEPTTWLSTFLVKGDKAHFLYRAYREDDPKTPDVIEPYMYRQHYVRYDLATARIDRPTYIGAVPNILEFKTDTDGEGDRISVSDLFGFSATKRSIKEIFCVSRRRDTNEIAVLKSLDNGLTWQPHALGATPNFESLAGSPQVTDDGYIIGLYTESNNFYDPGEPKRVKFFKVAR